MSLYPWETIEEPVGCDLCGADADREGGPGPYKGRPLCEDHVAETCTHENAHSYNDPERGLVLVCEDCDSVTSGGKSEP